MKWLLVYLRKNQTNREKDENKTPQYFIFVLDTVYIIWIEKNWLNYWGCWRSRKVLKISVFGDIGDAQHPQASPGCPPLSTVNQIGQKNKHSKAAQIPSIMEMFLHHGGESAVHGLSSCNSRCRSQYGTAPTIKLDGYHIGFSPHRDIVLTE